MSGLLSTDPRIEKVARAMCKAMGLPEDHDPRSAPASPEETSPADPPWKSFEREARLAIAAHDALQGKPPRRVHPRGDR